MGLTIWAIFGWLKKLILSLTNGITQIVASKDQANLAAHNRMQKGLTVALAETYNGTNITNEEPTHETGDGSTDISDVIVDGSAKVQIQGKSYDNQAEDDDAWATALTGWTSADDSIVAEKYRLTKASDATGERDISSILDVTKYWFLSTVGTSNTDTAGGKFDVLEGTGGAVIASSGVLEDDNTERIGLILQPSDLTGHTPHLLMTHKGSGYTEWNEFFIVKITAAQYAEGLPAMFAYFNYISGLQSTLPCDVVSSDINVFDKTKVTRGYKLDTDGTLTVSALDYTSDYMIIRPSEQWVGQDEEYAFFDSNFVFISYGTGAGAITAPATAFYERISSALTTLDTMQIEQSASATTYQAYNVNIAHEPVTLPQVPSARNTFNFDTGVLGVNVSPTAVFGADTGLTPSGQSSAYANVDLYFIVFADGGYHATLPYLELYGSHAWTWVGSTATTDFTDDMVNPYEFVTLGTTNVFYVKIAKGANISVAKALLNGEKYFYELADASKYTVAYPPQTLIAWKGGEMSRIPKLHKSLISTGTHVDFDHKVSRIEAVYEYVGSEASLVDSADLSLDGDGMGADITGASSSEVYYFDAFYDTSGSTYGTQVAQFTTYNIASRMEGYNDLYLSVAVAKVPASNTPTWASFFTNLNSYTFDVADYIDLATAEMLHGYVEGTDLECHVHFITNGLDATDRTVKFTLYYSIGDMNEVMAAEDSLTAEYTIVGSTADKTHLFLDMGDITGTGYKIGSLIKFRLKRVAGTGTDPANDPFVEMVGIHYQVDAVGSKTELTK